MCFIAILYLVSAAPHGDLTAQEITGAATFSTGVSDVRVDVQVTYKNNLIDNLTAQDFAIEDEGQPQKIVYFGHDAEPVSLILLLDISGSMQPHVERISATAREALGYLKPVDRVAILVFGKDSQVHQEFSGDFAETARRISSAVQDHDVGAGTYINHAVTFASDYMRVKAPQRGRRAILILTDNLSYSYNISDQQVLMGLYRADTVMNAIVVGRGIRPGATSTEVYKKPELTPTDVFKLAEETGGEAVRADNPEISFREMIERIRTRYSLSYHSPGGRSGSFRRIEVRLTGEGYKKFPWADVRARRGYYVE